MIGLVSSSVDEQRAPKLEQSAEESQEPATIHGEIKHPFGLVARAFVTVGARSVFSDASGKYEVSDLEPGTYSINVNAPFPGYVVAPQSVVVAAGETKVVDVFLDFEKAVVHGYVFSEKGKPVAGASLSGLIGGMKDLSVTTDEKGYFKFDSANPGTQYVRVNAAGHMAQTLDFSVKRGEETKLDFVLTKAAHKINGVVLNEKGAPLEAEVALSSATRVIIQKEFSDPNTGYFEFSVVPGTYGLLAAASDYTSEGWRGEVTADTKVDLHLERLPPPPTTQPD